MLCPKCKSKNNFVVDSRPKAATTYRRRECECGNRFSTIEIDEAEYKELKKIQDYILRYSKPGKAERKVKNG